MKCKTLPNGNILSVIDTANSQQIQIEISESGTTTFPQYSPEYINQQEDYTVDGTLYSYAENAVATASSETKLVKQMFYSLVTNILNPN